MSNRMVFLLLLLGLSFAGVVILVAAGVAFYEFVIVKRRKDDRDYTRSYDWTTSDQ